MCVPSRLLKNTMTLSSFKTFKKISDSHLFWVPVLLAVALATRLPFVTNQAAYFDSPEHVGRVASGWHAVVYSGHLPQQIPFLLTGVALRAWGGWDASTALNLASVLYGALAALGVFFLTGRLLGRAAGLAAAFLYLSVPFNWVADLSGYSSSLVQAGLVFALWAVLRYLERPASWPWLLLYAAGLVVAVAAHIYAVMWVLLVPAVGFLALALGRLADFRWKAWAMLAWVGALAVLASLLAQGPFAAITRGTHGAWTGVALLLGRDGGGGHDFNLKMLGRALVLPGYHMGWTYVLVMAVAAGTWFWQKSRRSAGAASAVSSVRWMALALVSASVGLFVINRFHHWGLCSRLAQPAVLVYPLFLLALLSLWSPGWRRGALFALFAISAVAWGVTAARVASRPMPLAVMGEAQAEAGRDPHAHWVSHEWQRPFDRFPSDRRLWTVNEGSVGAVLRLEAERKTHPSYRLFLDSHSFHFTRWRMDGWFLAWDSVQMGRFPQGGLRSCLGEVFGQVDAVPHLFLPDRQFVMEFKDRPAPIEELRRTLGPCNRGLVIVSNLKPGTLLNLYADDQPRQPVRLDRADPVLWLLARLGFGREPLSFGYAGKHGVAVLPTWDATGPYHLYADTQEVRG